MFERKLDRYFRRLPSIDRRRFSRIKEGVANGLYIDRLEGATDAKVALVEDIAETIYLATPLVGVVDPNVRLGNGVLNGRSEYIAYTCQDGPRPTIVIAKDYILAQLDKADTFHDLRLVTRDPSEVISHEVGHMGQFAYDKGALLADLDQADYDANIWLGTGSEQAAQAFGRDFAFRLALRRPLR